MIHAQFNTDSNKKDQQTDYINNNNIVDQSISKINESIPFVPNSTLANHGANLATPKTNYVITKDTNVDVNKILQPENSQLDQETQSVSGNQLMISVKDGRFIVHDSNAKEIGYFTVKYLAKYLGNYYDTKKQFLPEYQDTQYENSKKLIKMLLFHQKYNGPLIDIRLREPSESGFMSDLDLLFRLNNELYKYSESGLYSDLHPVVLTNKIKIERHIKKFIFIMLNYTLKVINLISPTITDPNMKSKLLECSTQMVYRINLFVQDQLGIINKKTLSLKNMMKSNIELKQKIEAQILNYQKSLPNKQTNVSYNDVANDIRNQLGLSNDQNKSTEPKPQYIIPKHDKSAIFL